MLFFSYKISFSTQIFFPTLCAQTFAFFSLTKFLFLHKFLFPTLPSYGLPLLPPISLLNETFCFFFSYKISFSTQIYFSYIAILWFTSLPLLPPISLLNKSTKNSVFLCARLFPFQLKIANVYARKQLLVETCFHFNKKFLFSMRALVSISTKNSKCLCAQTAL